MSDQQAPTVVFSVSDRARGYDPGSEAAVKRRAEGLCGYCGHPSHNRKIGCEVCGPEVCPVILESDEPFFIAKLDEIMEGRKS